MIYVKKELVFSTLDGGRCVRLEVVNFVTLCVFYDHFILKFDIAPIKADILHSLSQDDYFY